MDGRTLITEGKYKVNDTIILEVPEQKIVEHLPLEKGARILLTGGRHSGTIASVEKIEGENIVFKTEKEVFETSKKHALVIGDKVQVQ